jgi:hypothetical protein
MKATTPHLDEMDYDTALLPGQQIDDDALDAISSTIDGLQAAEEMVAHLEHMKAMLMAGHPAYSTREQFAVDLDQLADRIHIAVGALLG